MSDLKKSKINQTLSSLGTTKNNLNTELDGTATFLSVSLLQHSSPKISFTKAERFLARHTESSLSPLKIPNTLSGRYTGMGYGRKEFLPPYHMKNAQCYPAPDQYMTQREFMPKNSRKGRTFGVARESFSKKFLDHAPNYVTPEIAKDYPGPRRTRTPAQTRYSSRSIIPPAASNQHSTHPSSSQRNAREPRRN